MLGRPFAMLDVREYSRLKAVQRGKVVRRKVLEAPFLISSIAREPCKIIDRGKKRMNPP